MGPLLANLFHNLYGICDRFSLASFHHAGFESAGIFKRKQSFALLAVIFPQPNRDVFAYKIADTATLLARQFFQRLALTAFQQ